MQGTIIIVVNLTLIIFPSKAVYLALNEICTASSKDKFTDIFKGINTATKHNTFNIGHSRKTDSENR